MLRLRRSGCSVWFENYGCSIPPEDGGGAAEFAGYAAGWIAAGARVVGGCCGTTPEHMRAVAQLLRNAP